MGFLLIGVLHHIEVVEASVCDNHNFVFVHIANSTLTELILMMLLRLAENRTVATTVLAQHHFTLNSVSNL